VSGTEKQTRGQNETWNTLEERTVGPKKKTVGPSVYWAIENNRVNREKQRPKAPRPSGKAQGLSGGRVWKAIDTSNRT